MRKTLYCLSLLTGTCFSGYASAQSSGNADAVPGGSDEQAATDEIIVTATRRETNLQATPLAITALSGDALAERRITNLEALASALPSVTFNRYLGQARIGIRGLGNDTISPAGEGRVAFHINGVYVSRNSVALGTLFDVDRVEVVRGPQGTLFGRNATAGAVNVITKKPTQAADGYAAVSFGNYDARIVDFAIGGAILPSLSARLALQTSNRDGWGRNLYTGNDIDDENAYSGRLSLRWQPAEGADINFTADYHREKDTNYASHYNGSATAETRAPFPLAVVFGGTIAPDPRDINSERDPRNRRESFGAAIDATFALGDRWTLKSLTGYRNSRYDWDTDFDYTQVSIAPYGQAERSDQYSQEFQLQYGSDRLNGVVGIYGFAEKAFGQNYILVQSANAPPSFLTQGYRIEGDIKTGAGAAFGELTYNITDRLAFIAGGRLSVERKSIFDTAQLRRDQPYTAPVNGPYRPGMPVTPSPGFPRMDQANWTSFTPKAGLTYQASNSLFFFATYNNGFKSGGYSIGVLQPAFKPEKVESFEIGERATLFDGKLRLNATAFRFNYTDMQVSRSTGTAVIVDNASSAKVTGLELETTFRPVKGLKFDYSGSFIHSEYGNFVPIAGEPNVKGNRLTSAPKWQGLVGVTLDHDMSSSVSASLRGELEHRSGQFFYPQNTNRYFEEGNAKFNAILNVDFADIDLNVSVFARNITNKLVWSIYRFGSPLFGSPVGGVLEAPRTFGIRLSKKLFK